MGLFANLNWVAGEWVEESATGAPRLTLTIHDSDVGTIAFSPAPAGLGLFHLGYEPSDYFEDPSASAPVDHDAEASAFSAWALAATGREVAAEDVRAMMAEPEVEPDDVFVEETAERLLALLGLELPTVP